MLVVPSNLTLYWGRYLFFHKNNNDRDYCLWQSLPTLPSNPDCSYISIYVRVTQLAQASYYFLFLNKLSFLSLFIHSLMWDWIKKSKWIQDKRKTPFLLSWKMRNFQRWRRLYLFAYGGSYTGLMLPSFSFPAHPPDRDSRDPGTWRSQQVWWVGLQAGQRGSHSTAHWSS